MRVFEHGAEASASLYSLIETAKANRLEPWAYLEHVFNQIRRAETLEDLDALLPHRIKLRNDGVNGVFTIWRGNSSLRKGKPGVQQSLF